jgi:hypothetical protein
MDEVALDLDVATVEDMRREAEDHGFDTLDGYVQWVLERRESVLAEHDTPDFSPESAADDDPEMDADGWETLDDQDEASDGDAGDEEGLEEVELPEEDGADDDDVAAALEEIELDDEEES